MSNSNNNDKRNAVPQSATQYQNSFRCVTPDGRVLFFTNYKEYKDFLKDSRN